MTPVNDGSLSGDLSSEVFGFGATPKRGFGELDKDVLAASLSTGNGQVMHFITVLSDVLAELRIARDSTKGSLAEQPRRVALLQPQIGQITANDFSQRRQHKKPEGFQNIHRVVKRVHEHKGLDKGPASTDATAQAQAVGGKVSVKLARANSFSDSLTRFGYCPRHSTSGNRKSR